MGPPVKAVKAPTLKSRKILSLNLRILDFLLVLWSLSHRDRPVYNRHMCLTRWLQWWSRRHNSVVLLLRYWLSECCDRSTGQELGFAARNWTRKRPGTDPKRFAPVSLKKPGEGSNVQKIGFNKPQTPEYKQEIKRRRKTGWVDDTVICREKSPAIPKYLNDGDCYSHNWVDRKTRAPPFDCSELQSRHSYS